MRMPDPIPTFSTLVSRLREKYDKLAFVHVVEPRISAGYDVEGPTTDSNDFIQEIWGSRPLIKAGGFTRETAIKATEEDNVLVAIGRHFISNVSRLSLRSSEKCLRAITSSLTSLPASRTIRS